MIFAIKCDSAVFRVVVFSLCVAGFLHILYGNRHFVVIARICRILRKIVKNSSLRDSAIAESWQSIKKYHRLFFVDSTESLYCRHCGFAVGLAWQSIKIKQKVS